MSLESGDAGEAGGPGDADGVFADAPRPVTYLRAAVYGLAGLLFVSLLLVGTVAVIAEAKGTWHWQIHLESTISYMGVFVGAQLAALVPLAGALAVSRWWVDA